MTDVMTKTVVANESDVNRDPLSGATGAHPLGTAAGATSGVVAGAVAGLALGGPVGGVIGGAVGAVAGGLAGKSAAEAVNPTSEEIYWKETYVREPYYVQGRTWDYYAPGYRAGWEGRMRHDGRTFEEAEADLKASYAKSRSESDPLWQDISPAARAAWARIDSRRLAKQ